VACVQGKRGGVPQYNQPHALLVGGLQAMEKLFPGFSAELVAAGGVTMDWLREVNSVRPAAWRRGPPWLPGHLQTAATPAKPDRAHARSTCGLLQGCCCAPLVQAFRAANYVGRTALCGIGMLPGCSHRNACARP